MEKRMCDFCGEEITGQRFVLAIFDPDKAIHEQDLCMKCKGRILKAILDLKESHRRGQKREARHRPRPHVR